VQRHGLRFVTAPSEQACKGWVHRRKCPVSLRDGENILRHAPDTVAFRGADRDPLLQLLIELRLLRHQARLDDYRRRERRELSCENKISVRMVTTGSAHEQCQRSNELVPVEDRHRQHGMEGEGSGHAPECLGKPGVVRVGMQYRLATGKRA